MSQIRKLQNGGTPKYGVLRIGNKTYTSPEEIDAFEKYLIAGDRSYSPITGKWMNYIRSGHDISINPIDNTIQISGVSAEDYADLPGASKRQRNIVAEGRRTYGRNNWSTDFRNAIDYAGRFTYATPEEQQKSSKTKVSNGQIKIDYDTVDGKQVYSSNPSNDLIDPRIAAYLDYLSDEKWGDTNEWETALDSNTDQILKAWYKRHGDRSKAQAAIDVALNEVRTKPWNEVSEASRELLAYFNIIGPDEAKAAASAATTSYIDESGQVKKNSQNEKGQWGVYEGTGENGTIKGAKYTTYDVGATPYLINADRLGLFEGLDDSYLNSVIYNGRIYRPDEIGQNVQLQRLMDEITYINNNAVSPIEAYEQLKGKFNYTDYPDSIGNYGMYDASQHYINNKAIRDYLAEKGIFNAALFNATAGYNVDDGSTIYGIYDYSHSGTGPYGFRTPFYLIVGADGQLHLTEADENGVQHRHWTSIPYTANGRKYSDANSLIRAKEVINGKTYGRLEVTDKVDGSSYHFVVDENGKVYHVKTKNNGMLELELIDNELATRILNGEQIVPGDVTNSKRRAKHPEQYDPNYRSPVTRKEGGKIRELPIKLQMGSRLLATPTTVKENTPIDDRMSDSSVFSAYKWDELSAEDRKDVYAVGLDLLGAVLALSPDPYTSAAGLVSGLGATGLMTAADIGRGDFRLGRTAVSAGMDVLGALPIIGTTAKFAKVGKALGKSQKLLKTLSGLFIGAGFANAVPTLNKLVKEGPKSLTTDDLYALSGAVQASLGIGVRAKQRAGDAKLASMISETNAAKNAPVPTVTPHSAKLKYATDVNIKLKDTDVAEIKGAGENAGNLLRQKLSESYNVDPTTIEADNTALLRKFGFEIKDNVVTPIEGTTHTASSKRIKGGTEDTIKLEQDDVDYVLAGGENAGKRLRERLEAKQIDPNLINTDDKALLKQFGFNVKMSKGETPKILSVTETKPTVKEKVKEKVSGARKAISGEEKYSKWGFISDLWNGASKRRTYIDNAMQTPEIRSEIDAALAALKPEEGAWAKRAYGQSQYRIGETPGVIGRGQRYSWVSNEEAPKENIQQTLRQQSNIQVLPGHSDERGLPEMNNASQISPIHTPDEIPVELRTNSDLLALPSAEKIALPQNTGEAAIAIRPETGLVKIGKNYKHASMEKRAANLRRLQKSMNPLKTLSDLEKQNSDKLFTNEEEFNALIESLIKKNAVTRGNNTKSGEKYIKELVKRLKSLRDSGRAYKQGGIIKAQNGLNIDWTKALGTTIGYPIDIATTIRKKSHDLLSGVLPKGPDIKMPENKAVQQNPIGLSNTWNQKDDGERMGWRYKNWDGLDQRIPYWGLRAAQYLGVLGFQKKDRALGHKQIEAGRFHETPVTLNQYRTDSPALQHAENNLQQQQMNGSKAVTSDPTQYYAHKLSQQSAINNYLKDLTAQKSAFEAQMNTQNVGIQNQNIANSVQTANSNAARDASINSAHYAIDRAYNTDRKQSFENAMLEVTNALKTDNEKILKMGQLHAWEGFDRDYERALSAIPGYAEWKRTYENDPELRKKYASLEDYIENEQAKSWSTYRDARDKAEKERQRKQYEWTIRNGLLIPRSNFGYNGPAGYRKGGRVNGTTRYTLEPDERIWIDNNKAAHAKSAKLNDAAIKLLLRALK